MSIDGVNRRPLADLLQFKIDGKQHTASEKQPSVVSSQNGEQDGVCVSNKAQEFLKIRSMVDSLPDVRLDKVDQLAKAIDAGTYQPKATDIAAALIDKHMMDLKV